MFWSFKYISLNGSRGEQWTQQALTPCRHLKQKSFVIFSSDSYFIFVLFFKLKLIFKFTIFHLASFEFFHRVSTVVDQPRPLERLLKTVTISDSDFSSCE